MTSARLIADSSLATATLVGRPRARAARRGFGLWLILIGAGVGALGLGGLVRESVRAGAAHARRGRDPVSRRDARARRSRGCSAAGARSRAARRVLRRRGAATARGACALRGGWPRGAVASFIAGLLVLASRCCPGIDAYADELLSVHMVQHLLLMLLAPVLLLWGAPVRLALRACAPARTARDRSAPAPSAGCGC